ncbi:MAG: Rieske 2Fe-2S domain-containing protein [Proteobacteria bacterium]|nr:Rieske 2Fe-2S domain-containing protein [Pseudomonadota bacterium]
MKEEERLISRRKVIGYGWIAATAVVVGEMIAGTFAFLWPKTPGGKAEKLLIAGKVDDFQVGKMTLIRKEKLFINRTDEGLLAMSAICTHLSCIVRWNEPRNVFECPCHAGVFNAVGEVIAGPPRRPLGLHPVKIVENKIVVDTGKAIQRKNFDRSQLVWA